MKKLGIISIIFCVSLFFKGYSFVFAQTTSLASETDLTREITLKNQELEKIQQQIQEYQTQVNEISGQAKTLNQEVSRLKNSEKILETSIRSTHTKIDKTNYTIQKNTQDINKLFLTISDNKQAIASLLRSMSHYDDKSFVEFFLTKSSLSEILGGYHELGKIQQTLQENIINMENNVNKLNVSKQDLEKQKQELKNLSGELSDREKIITVARTEKDNLLKQTKNKESEYQKIIDDLQKRQEQIVAETREYESRLKFVLNTKNLPQTGSEPFGWPIENVVITQQFGRTVDSRRLYASGSHSGVDFRAAVGTPIYAVGSGVVEGTGDTDKTCPKASFGKWIFIRHPNGLATAYGHLSLIKVSAGQVVQKGELIGYSGNTGRSTGPHLHLTVYASRGANGEEGAKITQRPSSACSGKTYTMPLAPINAYLDPMVYLPSSGFTTKY